jgi:hypothetical protein
VKNAVNAIIFDFIGFSFWKTCQISIPGHLTDAQSVFNIPYKQEGSWRPAKYGGRISRLKTGFFPTGRFSKQVNPVGNSIGRRYNTDLGFQAPGMEVGTARPNFGLIRLSCAVRRKHGKAAGKSTLSADGDTLTRNYAGFYVKNCITKPFSARGTLRLWFAGNQFTVSKGLRTIAGFSLAPGNEPAENP